MTTNNFMKGTVKYGTPKETDHWLWQKVRNTSNYDLCSGSGQEIAEKTESQDSHSATSVEESVLMTLHNQIGFVDGPTFPQKDVANFSYTYLNPQVPGHTPLTKFSKSDSKSYGPQRISNSNAPNEVKLDKVDNVMDRGSHLIVRTKPAAHGRGQDSKGFWTRKAMWVEDQGKRDDDATGSSKHQNYHKHSNFRRILHPEIHYVNAETISETRELRRPKSAPSNANGFQELRTNVPSIENMATERIFSNKKASPPEVFTVKDHAATPSMGHFLERQLSLDGFDSRKTGKSKKLGHYTDKTSQKERVGEKEYSSYYAAQRWAPVEHSFGVSSIDNLMQDKARHDGEKHVAPSCVVKDVENAAVHCFEQRKNNLDISEIDRHASESKGMITSRPGESLINDHANFHRNRNIELGVLLPPTAQSNDQTKSSSERSNFAARNHKPAELKDHPGKVSPADENFSSVAPTILDAVHASLEGRRASQRLAVAVGNPVAELEKVLEAVAPTIKPVLEASESKKYQTTCKLESFRAEGVSEHGPNNISNTFRDDPLCRCRVDDFPLSAIWSWYEESCNYGVEVKSLDFRRADTCSRGEQFSVFFVPYLSGMQLFERTPSGESPKRELEANTLLYMDENREDSKEQGSSEFCNIEIFDTLLPKPLVRDEDYPSCCPYASEDAGELTCRTCFPHSEINCQKDVHLLFEFYDAEPPQQRRTLLQKVQELIRGEVGIHSQKEGDAALLGSLKLGDLHPASWFSVAWYPIYRIPEGLARDVFLTYHSFCHLIPSEENTGAECSVGISIPVIGLQYYNCQVDQWLTLGAIFQNQNEELCEVPAEVLQRRLNTLKKAAAAMSGHPADPTKATSMVYKHSDYQFFVNRDSLIVSTFGTMVQNA